MNHCEYHTEMGDDRTTLKALKDIELYFSRKKEGPDSLQVLKLQIQADEALSAAQVLFSRSFSVVIAKWSPPVPSSNLWRRVSSFSCSFSKSQWLWLAQALPRSMPTMELRASSLAQTRPRGGAKREGL